MEASRGYQNRNCRTSWLQANTDNFRESGIYPVETALPSRIFLLCPRTPRSPCLRPSEPINDLVSITTPSSIFETDSPASHWMNGNRPVFAQSRRAVRFRYCTTLLETRLQLLLLSAVEEAEPERLLLRDQFIFQLSGAIVIEVPQLGHATYIFTKPQDVREFCASTRSHPEMTFERTAETRPKRLGFIGRIMH